MFMPFLHPSMPFRNIHLEKMMSRIESAAIMCYMNANVQTPFINYIVCGSFDTVN